MKETLPETLIEKLWHHLPVTDVLALLQTDTTTGLDDELVIERRAHYGPNLITQKQRTPLLVRFLRQFHQPLIYILIVSAAITATLREWVDASIIFGVVLVNALIGFVQEEKAETAIAALAKIITTRAQVLRTGRHVGVPSAELVPGDIVLLAAGDKVPADIRLVRVRELAVDESALTGESVPVAKHSAHLERDLLLAERANMTYAGTLVTAGHATGIVVATGNATETGRISRLIADTQSLSTPLTRKIEWFSRILLYAILGLAIFTFTIGLVRGETVFAMFMAAVALAVGAIPEGLPAAVTITLAIGVSRMAKRNAVIRKLPAVETLGSTTVICSDKTGTLTQNQMTVEQLFAAGHFYTASGSGYAPEGKILRAGRPVEPHGALRECLTAGLLCNDATLEFKKDHWQINGDPTEAALIVSAHKGGLSADTLNATHPRYDVLPFESRYQYMATLHGDGENTVIYIKGAVERLLTRCCTMLDGNGHEVPLDAEKITQAAAAMATQALRVLAFARGRAINSGEPLNHHHINTGLAFLGLQGMIDPPRPEAVTAVAACHAAGIEIKMITGDHAVTAAAIAAQIGIITDDDKVLEGQEITSMSDAALARAVDTTRVFARVEPAQKLRLVQTLQARNHVVAMTGDGVNDAPALKQANIGVAMGTAGTEVAKEAADMVLLDDNFASIEAAIEEGRGVFDNLTKFIVWTLPTNFGEGLVITAAVISGTVLPILPVQILWINMTTAVLLGLMLAFEPIEKGIMRRRPRHPNSPILTPDLIQRIFLVGVLLLVGAFGLFLWERNHGAPLVVARTAAANVFVVGELFYLFNCRSMTDNLFKVGVFSNRWLVAGVSLMVVLQLLFTYLPAMNAWFGTAPIGINVWLRIIAVGLAINMAVSAEKWVRRRLAIKRQAITT